MNPAVTLAFAVVRRFPWRKVPVYWTAQMLGAFAASACAYAVYYGRAQYWFVRYQLNVKVLSVLHVRCFFLLVIFISN